MGPPSASRAQSTQWWPQHRSSHRSAPMCASHRNGRSNEGGHEPLCKRVGARCANDARANSRKCNAEAFRIGKVDPGGQALLQFDSHGRIGTEEIFHGRLTRQSLVAPAIEIRQRHETMSTRNSRSADFLGEIDLSNRCRAYGSRSRVYSRNTSILPPRIASSKA